MAGVFTVEQLLPFTLVQKELLIFLLEIRQKRSRYQTVTVLSFRAAPSAVLKLLPEPFIQKLL